MYINESPDNKKDILKILSKFKNRYTKVNVERTLKLVKSVIKDYKPIKNSIDNFF